MKSIQAVQMYHAERGLAPFISKQNCPTGRYVYSVDRKVKRGESGELFENSFSAHVGIEESVGDARLKY
jgi:hypothetical protein